MLSIYQTSFYVRAVPVSWSGQTQSTGIITDHLDTSFQSGWLHVIPNHAFWAGKCSSLISTSVHRFHTGSISFIISTTFPSSSVCSTIILSPISYFILLLLYFYAKIRKRSASVFIKILKSFVCFSLSMLLYRPLIADLQGKACCSYSCKENI